MLVPELLSVACYAFGEVRGPTNLHVSLLDVEQKFFRFGWSHLAFSYKEVDLFAMLTALA